MADEGDEPGIPRAALNKVIRDALPTARLSNDFRETLHMCCLQFVKHVGTEANRLCIEDQKKTISKEHLFHALSKLGFSNDYIEAGRSVLDRCNEEASRRQRRQSTRLEKCGIPEDELLKTQQALFEKARLEQATTEQLQVAFFQQHLEERMRLKQHGTNSLTEGGTSTAVGAANNKAPTVSFKPTDSDEDYDAE